MADKYGLKKAGMLGYLHGIMKGLTYRNDLPYEVRKILEAAIKKTDDELEEIKNSD